MSDSRAKRELLKTLDRQVTLYKKLLDVVRSEKVALLNVDVEKVEQLTESKAELLHQLKALEVLRQRWSKVLASDLNLNGPITLLNLAQKMEGDVPDRLRKIHSVLVLLVDRIQGINKSNELYATKALEGVQGALGDIKESIGGKQTYENKGGLKKGAITAGQLVSREA